MGVDGRLGDRRVRDRRVRGCSVELGSTEHRSVPEEGGPAEAYVGEDRGVLVVADKEVFEIQMPSG